jgi:dUTP pyrophosphatase
MDQALKGTATMKVTIQKVMPVESPTRAHATDAGLDLHVPEGQGCLVRSGAVYTIDLGVRVAIPDGYYGQLTLRSSAGMKGLSMPHGVGIIDAGYRGNVKAAVTALAEPVSVAAGDRICQLIILPLPTVDVSSGIVDDDTDRSEGAFGSTGTGATIRDYATQEAGTLTIGRLMGQLQDAAFRYGNDTPVAVIAGGGIGYEQGDGLLMINTVKTGHAGGWSQYRADTTGTPMAVIS